MTQRIVQIGACLGHAAGKNLFGDRSVEHAQPEARPRLARQTGLDAVTKFAGKPGQVTVGPRYPGIETGAQDARQRRRVTVARYGDLQRIALNHCRNEKIRTGGVVRALYQHVSRGGSLGQHRVRIAIVGDREHQQLPVDIRRDRRAGMPRQAARIGPFTNTRLCRRRDHGNARTGRKQSLDTPACDVPCAGNQNRAV